MSLASISMKPTRTSPAALPSGPKPVSQPARKMVLPTIPSFKPKPPVALPGYPTAPDVPPPLVASVSVDVREEVDAVPVAPTAPDDPPPPVTSVSVDVRDEVESLITEESPTTWEQEQKEKAVERTQQPTGYISIPAHTKKPQVVEEEKKLASRRRDSSQSRGRSTDDSMASQSRGRRSTRSESRSNTRERNTDASVASGQTKSSKQTMRIYGKDKSSTGGGSISKVKEQLSGISISKVIGNFLRSKSKSRSGSNVRSTSMSNSRSTPRCNSRSSGRSGSTGRGTDVPSSSHSPTKKQLLPPSYPLSYR